MPLKLDNEIVKARRALMQSYGSEAEGWFKVLGQLEAQVADAVLGETQKAKTLENYKGKTVVGAGGKAEYECSPLEELIRWRLWDNTGAGMMAELGSHQLDAASIFVSALYPENKPHPHPLRVTAAANRPIFGFDRDIEDHVCCIIEFPLPDYEEKDSKTHRRKIDVQYASINGNGYLGYGELVYGTKGTLALEKEQDLKLMTGSGDEDEGETAVKISGGGTGPSLDTQSSGPAQERRSGRRPGEPRLRGRVGTLGLVHPASRAREQAPLPSPRGDGRRHHCPDNQPGREDRTAGQFQAGMVRPGEERHAGRRFENFVKRRPEQATRSSGSALE